MLASSLNVGDTLSIILCNRLEEKLFDFSKLKLYAFMYNFILFYYFLLARYRQHKGVIFLNDNFLDEVRFAASINKKAIGK